MSWFGSWFSGAFGKWFGYAPEDEDDDTVPVAEGGHKKQQKMWQEQAEAMAIELIRRRKEAARLALLEEDELELAEMAGVYATWRRHE